MSSNSKKLRPSLQDIADRVGITKMTVSRFMRHPEMVSEQTRLKISTAVKESGYIHNRAPAMLAQASSKAIAILLPSLSNQVFANFTQGVEFITNQRGYEVLISHFAYNEQTEERKVAAMLSYHVDGIILTGTTHTEQTQKMLRMANIPVVEAMELTENPIDMVVGLDHELAAYTAVKAMLTSGKKNVAYFGARLDNRTQLRIQGYDRAISEFGAKKYHFLTQQHSSYTLGKELLEQALLQCPSLDAVFCTNDDIAIGTILACNRMGIIVPGEIAVIGYNALDIGQAITPTLTSINTPRYKIGEKSAKILLDSIEGKPSKQKIFDLGFTLARGQSFND